MARPTVYLDYHAAAPLRPQARAALLGALDLTGNASSVHGHGRALRHYMETGRRQLAKLAGAEPGQVIFTGSASEALTQAICGGAKAFSAGAVALSAGEHAAALKAGEATGLPLWTLPLDGAGRIDLDRLADMLARADAQDIVLLVAVHWVNNETGVVQPMEAIGALVGPTRHILVVDAVQALGRLPLDFSASAPDMLAVSGHKIGAPAGIGALLAKSHADTVRLIPGGGPAQGPRGASEAGGLITAFGAAAEAVAGDERERVAALVDELEAGLRALASDVVIFGQEAQRIGTVVNFAVPGLGNASAMMALDLMGISVSSGSACSSGKVGPSHVLAAMGVAPELARCALRVSLGWNSSRADIAAFLAGFATVLARRRDGRAA